MPFTRDARRAAHLLGGVVSGRNALARRSPAIVRRIDPYRSFWTPMPRMASSYFHMQATPVPRDHVRAAVGLPRGLNTAGGPKWFGLRPLSANLTAKKPIFRSRCSCGTKRASRAGRSLRKI